MIIKRHDSKCGISGCYKCKQRAAKWKFTLSLLGECCTGTEGVEILLCDDCARFNETQLRIYFLGQ